MMVSEAEAAAVRQAFHERGEAAAVAELRRFFPGLEDDAHAAWCAKSIASWQPRPPAPPAAPVKAGSRKEQK